MAMAAEIKAQIETAEHELQDSRVDCQTVLSEQIDAIERQRLRRVLDDLREEQRSTVNLAEGRRQKRRLIDTDQVGPHTVHLHDLGFDPDLHDDDDAHDDGRAPLLLQHINQWTSATTLLRATEMVAFPESCQHKGSCNCRVRLHGMSGKQLRNCRGKQKYRRQRQYKARLKLQYGCSRSGQGSREQEEDQQEEGSPRLQEIASQRTILEEVEKDTSVK